MINQEAIYTYDVFISYRHLNNDEKWAKWLLDSLETWKVPKELVKKGFPKRIGRVFRDEDELHTSSDLNKTIENALMHSKYLVVICSRNTPKSSWIEKEIKIFKKFKGSERIISLLIDGEPNESFPEELTFTEENGVIIKIDPLAADVRKRKDQKEKETKQIALLKILACILDCNFDDLRQREKLREKKKLRNKFITLSSIFLTAILSLTFIWDYNRVKIKYYNTFTYKHGIPKGIGKLSKSMYLKRNITYIFEEQRRVLKQVRRVNSYGILKDDEENFNVSVWLPEMDVSGNIKRIVCKDHNNRIVMIREYSADLRIIELQNEFNMPFVYEGSSIVRYEVEYNKNGYVTNEFYYRDSWNTPTENEEGFYGKKYEVDNNGRVILASGMNINKEEKSINGIFKIKLYHNKLGNITKEEFLDKENNLLYNTYSKYGYSYLEKKYDKNGNLIKKSFFDNNGKRIIPPNQFYSSILYTLDNRGNIIAENYLDTKDEPVNSSYAKCYFKYDEFGNNIETFLCDINGKNTYGTNGYSGYAIKYDNNNNIIEKIHYDINTNTTFINNGYSIIKIEYDNNFNKKSISYYGIDTNKILNNLNYHKSVIKYDTYSRITNISYYDTNNNPINAYIYNDEYLGYDSYASHIIEYDKRGNIIQNSYLDENGKYKNLLCGYAISRYSHNDIGLITEESYYDKNENKAAYINDKKWFNGFHKLRKTYDEKGNIIKILFYDKNDNLYMANGKFEYSSFKNVKCAGILYEYTNAKITKITYLGTNEEPINAVENISSIIYNEVSLDNIKEIINKDTKCNNFIKESYFDTNNNPVLIDGYHSSYLGNNNGERILIFTDINNKLTINANKYYGCAYLMYKYKNPYTNEDEITYYGVNNENILNNF